MIYIVTGVSGCGKTTLGTLLSEKLGWTLYEGDDFHPQENIEKMARGEPLTDQDRLPWLLKLHDAIENERRSGSDAVVEAPPPGVPDVFFLSLYGEYDLIYQRVAARRGHFMAADLLRSQFDILEPPGEEENVLPLDIRRSIHDLAGVVEEHFLSQKSPPSLLPRQ